MEAPQAFEFETPDQWYRAWCKWRRDGGSLINLHAVPVSELASIAGVHEKHYRRNMIKQPAHPDPVDPTMRRKLYPVRRVMAFLYSPEKWGTFN